MSQALHDVRMHEAQSCFTYLEGALVQRFGLAPAPLNPAEFGQVMQTRGYEWMRRPQGGFAQLEGALDQGSASPQRPWPE